MHAEQLIKNMDKALYLRLKEAVETGRWPDGNLLTDQQRQDSMTLVMLYQARHLNQDQPFSIGSDGQMILKSKSELRKSQQSEQEITRFSLSDTPTSNSSEKDR